MAMNIHQEARRRQMHMDRVCEARRRMALGQQDDQDQEVCVATSSEKPADPVRCTDQGQFYQTREQQDENNLRDFNGVVFEKVVHDPNFYYRSAVEHGTEPPLHVDPIYKVMYPATYKEIRVHKTKMTLAPFRVSLEGHRNRYRNRQHLAPHCDRLYAVIYPGKDNSDYIVPETRRNRRENTFVDIYEISKKVSGRFLLPHPQRAVSSTH